MTILPYGIEWEVPGSLTGPNSQVLYAVGETIAFVMVPVSAVKPLIEHEILQVRTLSMLEPR